LVFFLSRKIFRKDGPATIVAFLFLLLAGYSETIFWISSTGFLFTASLALGGLLSFIRYEESRKKGYYVLAMVCAFLSPLFHELGIVTPLLYFVYLFTMRDRAERKLDWHFLIPIPLYLGMRFLAQSHWLSGDYNYNILKFPFNAVGNIMGYVFLALGGPLTLPVYEKFRVILRSNILVGIVLIAVFLWILMKLYKHIVKLFTVEDKQIVTFGFFFIIVSLLPFIGLGNIASRYSYLASVGVVILFTFFIGKMYIYLLHSGRTIAISGIALVLGVFCLFQIMQIEKIHDNWASAGEKVRRFIVSIDSAYEDKWATLPMEFHFVNVPIRNGEAWVFPVGIPDALWLVFRNPAIRVFQEQTVDEAFSLVDYESSIQKVYEFDETGMVTQKIKKRSNSEKN
jgi:hypothetical protein